jgi:hypothetical protein
MADSLLFDGAGDFRDFSAGTVAGSGALTCVFILKKGLDAAWQNPGGWNALDAHYFISDINRLTISDGTNFQSSAASIVIADGWLLTAVTKAAGTVTPRFHIYNYGTATWVHQNGAGTITNLAALTTYTVGQSGQGFQDFNGSILLDAVWDSELSDVTLETLEFSLAAFVAASPKELRRFNTVGTITPVVGTSTQTAGAGGTLDTGDVPAGWSDALTLAAPAVDPDVSYLRHPKYRRSYA